MAVQDLVSLGLIEPKQARLLELQRDRLLRIGIRKSLTEIAVENGFVKSSEVQEGSHSLHKELIDIRLAQSLRVMPLSIEQGILKIRSARRLTESEQERLRVSARQHTLGLQDIDVVPGDIDEILRWLRKRHAISQNDLEDKVEGLNAEPNSPILIQGVLEGLYTLAIVKGASDIHLRKDNNNESQNTVEFRIDGELSVIFLLSYDAMSSLFARIKGLSNLDISNSFVPQDGRKSMEFKGRKIDMRVATIPTIDGEKITIRMLDPDNLMTLDEMFHPYPCLLAEVKQVAKLTPGMGGMVIVSGPTGSGKTTTNYAFIREIDRVGLSVMTAEDPVEYEMPLITQSQVRPDAGVDFPTLLRAQLRNDPDVILVGEMRDALTAEIAVRSADTGHAIFTTLHTDDAISTVNRFLSMLPPDFAPIGKRAIANNLRAIINQRLARKLCICAQDISLNEISDAALDYFTVSSPNLRECRGCAACDGSGYKGRVMVPEALFFASKKLGGEDATETIISGELTRSFAESCSSLTYHSLKDSCEQLLATGLIDLAEAKRLMGIN